MTCVCVLVCIRLDPFFTYEGRSDDKDYMTQLVIALMERLKLKLSSVQIVDGRAAHS